MTALLSARQIQAVRGALLAVALALPITVGAQFYTPVLSGPSTARIAETATFTGSWFAPNISLTIAVVAPNGTEAHFVVMTSPEGSMSHALTPTLAGKYTLKVLDSAGAVLTQADVFAAG